MELNGNEKIFLEITAAAMNNKELTEKTDTENIDYRELFGLAKEQKLMPFVFEYVRTLPQADSEKNKDLFSSVKRSVIAQVLNQTTRSIDFSALYRKLLDASLHPILVKGQICSRLYPLKSHRISADDDIYVRDDEFLACHKVLLENGLKVKLPDGYTEDDLMKEDEVTYIDGERGLYIEMHRRLFDSSEDAHDELNGFFAYSHDELYTVDGFYTLTPHKHMLYLILHAYKHFVSCGIGLRQFYDIGFFAREYESEINWDKLYDECLSVHAATFARAVIKIAHENFGIEFDTSGVWKDGDIDCVPLLHDVLCGGVYGSNDYTRLHSSTVTLGAVRASRKGKRGNYIATLFPKRSYMEKRYPYVKKYPVLLPLAWGNRIIDYAKESSKSTDDSASESLKLAKERIELMKLYDII